MVSLIRNKLGIGSFIWRRDKKERKMDALAVLLKPPVFTVSTRDDPEQTLQDWMEYIDRFQHFLSATGVGGSTLTTM